MSQIKNIHERTEKMNEIDYEAVGKRIRKLRLEHQMSQKQLCEAVGITQGHLSKAENGQVISAEVVEKLAGVLEVSVDELLHGTEESKANRKKWDEIEKYSSKGKSEEEKKKAREFTNQMVNLLDNSVDGIDLERANALMEASQEGLDLLKACDNTFSVTADETGNMPYHYTFDENVDAITDEEELKRRREAEREKKEKVAEMKDLMEEHARRQDLVTYIFRLKLEFTYSGYRWTAEEVKRLDSDRQEIIDDEFIPADWNADPNEDLGRDTVERVPYKFEMTTHFDDALKQGNGLWSEKQGLLYDLAEKEYYEGEENLPLSYRKAVEDGQIRNCPCRTEDGKVDWKGEFERFKKMITIGVTRKSLYQDEEGNSAPYDIFYRGQSYNLNERGKIKVISAGYYEDEYKYQIDDKIVTEAQLKSLLEYAEDDVFEFKRVR